MWLSLVWLTACKPPSEDPSGPKEQEGPLGTGLEVGALRRLSPSAYQNTVRDLFPGVALPEVELVPDPLVHGFDNNGESQNPSALLVQQHHDAAASIAEAAAAQPDAVFGCPADGGADPLGCGTAFLEGFGPRVFRRPLEPAELDEAQALFEEVLAQDGFEVAVQVALQLWLQSPEFLYLPEIAPGLTGGDASSVVLLGPFELASRMSYFLWNTMPDDALLEAAARGDLDTLEGIEAETERMLDDPRAIDAIDNFDRLWLTLDKVDAVSLDPATYPDFDATLREQIRQETTLFARRAVQEGTLASLLTDRGAVLEPEIAALYGVQAAPGELVELPADERAGVLTRAAFLAIGAHAVHPSPVKRGVFVLERLLCSPPAPPPPGVDTAIPEDSESSAVTNRERYVEHEERPGCAGCHIAIDGIGFGFENYDSMGAWRTEDAGQPVDATGTFEVGDLKGEAFSDALQASTLLAGSRTVSDCVTESWARYALGRSLGTGDEAALFALAEAFAGAEGEFRELIVEIVKSEAFRSRRTP
jgi:hypothetical protein